MTKKTKITIAADTIIKALREKHHKDVFIPECKTGPTIMGSHSRFDVLVMIKSWAHPSVIGYEIKTNRQDFTHDNKWSNYLEYCNEFYFVCPPGIIAVTEVPNGVGLYWTSGSGTKVYQKRKAIYRNIAIPDSLWRYILMWRARIGDEINPNIPNDQDRWKIWLEDRKVNRAFGNMVGRAIREQIRTEIDKVQDESQRMKRLIDKYDDIKHLLEQMGYDPASFSEYDVQRKISTGAIDTRDATLAINSFERNLLILKSFIASLTKH